MIEVIYRLYVILMVREASYQEYLTINGDCVLCEDLKDGRVSVLERYHHDYHQTQYNSMAEIIEEKFQEMITRTIHAEDHVIVASDTRHNQFIAKIFRHKH